jgi:uncharacterized protein (TIGR00290 family)
VALSWSGGKDSALALHALRADPTRRVTALVTTVAEGRDRIAVHGVRRALLHAQARSLGIALVEVAIPERCTNAEYERVMGDAFRGLAAEGAREIAFGDLYLADVRAYRDGLVERAGLVAHYPLWGRDTGRLAREFIALGFRARLVCVDSAQLDPSFCGRELDDALLAALPPSVDPCGENGEFHSFVFDGPPFGQPIDVAIGETVDRGGFRFCDLLLSAGATTAAGANA